MPLRLIDDGYTLDDTVKAPSWPRVAVKYRPALPQHTRDFVIARSKAFTGTEEMKAISALLRMHLVGWDIEDAKGQPAPVSDFTINRIPDAVLQRIIDLITGYGPEKAADDEKNSVSG
jgi:hypothetical protein